MATLQPLPGGPDRYGIIDCHFHPGFAEDQATAWFFPVGSPSEQVALLRKSGVTRACGSVICQRSAAVDFATVERLNRSALAFRDQFPDFYIPAIHVHPNFPDESCRELERYYRNEGVRWVGELVGYVMGYGDAYDSKGGMTIFAEAEKLRIPVNFHCSSLDVVRRLCGKFPALPFVLAHPSMDKQVFLDRLAAVKSFPNLYLDLSGSGIMRYGMVRHGIDQAGKEKLLFGTDFPICNPAAFVHGALFEPLSEEERVAVFSGNFLRLTGLQ